MSYIGNQPTSVAFLTDQYSGTGSQTAFTLSAAPANTASILVAVSGVLQDPTTYSTSGLTLTFSAAPPSGTGNISVRYLGVPASNITTTAYRTVTEFTATAGQTTFSVPSYTAGYINVYRNGALLGTADYTATSGTSVVLASAASSGDLVVTESFYVSSVLNAIPAVAGAVTDSYITSMAGSKLTGTQVIPKATLPTGSVLQVVQGTLTGQTTYSSPTSFTQTSLTGSITPTSSSSKILVIMSYVFYNASTGQNYQATIYRNNTTNISPNSGNAFPVAYVNGATNVKVPFTINYLDSPSTTSSTSYTCWIKASGGNIDFGDGSGTGTVTLMEIAA
jgi:hypothetical protein